MEFTVMNKNSHPAFEKYIAPIFGTEFSTIVFITFSVTLIKCKAAISKFSAPPSHLLQGDHAKLT